MSQCKISKRINIVNTTYTVHEQPKTDTRTDSSFSKYSIDVVLGIAVLFEPTSSTSPL